MKSYSFASIVSLSLASTALAADLVYVTDLEIYTLLAPCAQDAISYVVQGQTNSACGEAVTDLQSCVCTKNNNLNALSTTLSSSVSYECGSTASDDLSSVYVVYDKYCNQDGDFTFATPTENMVTAYPTDFPAYQNLAKCAQYGVSVALQSLTYDVCPEPASLLATCACKKNQNSLRASQTINSSVKYSCSNNDDISSAQQFLSAYCNLVDGTTAFPIPSNPPGDMTYYITALPAYSKLAPCAQSGVSAGLYSHNSELCPSGPQALASCACLKSGMSNMATSLLSSSVKYYCDETAIEDVASAIDLFGFYCSAARKEVVATGVSQSIGQSYATGDGVGAAAGPGETGKDGSSKKDGSKDGADAAGGGVSMAAVAGGVVAVIGVLAIIGVVVFFMLKKRRANRERLHNPATAYNRPPGTADGAAAAALLSDKPELAGTPIIAPPAPPPAASPHLSFGKTGASRTENVSPVSAYSNGQSPFTPPPQAAELQSNEMPVGAPPMPELQGGVYMAQQQQQQQQQGQYQMRPELQGNQGFVQPQTYQTRPELAGVHVYPQGQMAQPQGNHMYGQPPGQHGYAPPSSQPIQEAYGTPVYQNQQQQQYPATGYYSQPAQQPPRAELQGGWQAGPVQTYQELDGGQFNAR